MYRMEYRSISSHVIKLNSVKESFDGFRGKPKIALKNFSVFLTLKKGEKVLMSPIVFKFSYSKVISFTLFPILSFLNGIKRIGYNMGCVFLDQLRQTTTYFCK